MFLAQNIRKLIFPNMPILNIFTILHLLHWSTHILLFVSHYRFLTNFDMGNTKMTSIFAHSIWILQKLSEIEEIFKAHGKNLWILKNSVCTFYCTQNDRLDPMVSMQKSVWKTDHSGLRYLRKPKMGLQFGLACHVEKHFCKYLGPGWSIFQTDFCIETMGSSRSF